MDVLIGFAMIYLWFAMIYSWIHGAVIMNVRAFKDRTPYEKFITISAQVTIALTMVGLLMK